MHKKIIAIATLLLLSTNALAGSPIPVDEPSSLLVIASVAAALGFLKWKNRNK